MQQSFKKAPSVKKGYVQCGLFGLKMYINNNLKEQRKQSKNTPVKVFNNGRFNAPPHFKNKPVSGNPNLKSNHYSNHSKQPVIAKIKQPQRGISSANPNLSSKLFYNSSSHSLQKGNPLYRSLPKSNLPSHMNIKINNSLNATKIRKSVALPFNKNIYNRRTPVAKQKHPNHYANVAKALMKSETKSSQGSQLNKSTVKSSFKEYYALEEENLEHRKAMEDFHQVVVPFCNDKAKAYFAIFDGHSGREPAIYCKDNLHLLLAKALHLNSSLNVDKSLHETFLKVDEELKKRLKTNDAGTTATVILIQQENNMRTKASQTVLYCANVGDSKGYIILKTGKVTRMTSDHKCTDTVEVDRIKKAGGVVFSGRVFGTLALTRTLGDIEMKNYGVLCTPSISKHIINEESLYAVIASDGVWDVVNENDLIQYSQDVNCIAESLCKQLVKLSMERDSRDNISCIVIKL